MRIIDSECDWVRRCECMWVNVIVSEFDWIWVSEFEVVSVSKYECVSENECKCLCVCLSEWWESEYGCECQFEWVCVRESEGEYECVYEF